MDAIYSSKLRELLRVALGPEPGVMDPIYGSAYDIEHTGGATTRPTSTAERSIVVSPKGPPRQWIVSMRGVITQPSDTAPVSTWPMAIFKVEWQIGGASFETIVDGFSDQFLVVFAEKVTVSGLWDLDENGNAQWNVSKLVGTTWPRRMTLSASVSPGEGAGLKARRTLFMASTTGGVGSDTFNIPYAATSFIVRSGDVGLPAIGDVLFTARSGGINELYSAANVRAKHDVGEFLSVPGISDRLNISAVAPSPELYSVEFQLDP